MTMFSTNRLKLNSCPIRATRPSATAMAKSAMTMGTTAATIEAKTMIRTISAMPMPIDSPFRRSSSAIFVKSTFSDPVPAICTAKPFAWVEAAMSRSFWMVASSKSLSVTVTSV